MKHTKHTKQHEKKRELHRYKMQGEHGVKGPRHAVFSAHGSLAISFKNGHTAFVLALACISKDQVRPVSKATIHGSVQRVGQ